MLTAKHGKRIHTQNVVSDAIKENEKCLIHNMPDMILVLIFQSLDTISLVSASKVCRRWYHISLDKSFTSTFDLTCYPMGIQQLWKVSRRKLTENTHSVHVRGKLNKNKLMEKLTLPYLADLFKRCAKITKLSFEHFDLREVPLSYFIQSQPSCLVYLSLRESMLTMDFFNDLKEAHSTLLPKIKTLNLHSCSKISNRDLEAISYLRGLEKLVLCNCYRISARGIPTIVQNIKTLKYLDFSGCPAINDVALVKISMLALKELVLRFCHLVTDYGVSQLFKPNNAGAGKSLKKLDLYSCHALTDKSLVSIITVDASQLRELNIGACSKMTEEKKEAFKMAYPDCVLHDTRVQESDQCVADENDFQCCSRMENNT